jgi:hypothetical protein
LDKFASENGVLVSSHESIMCYLLQLNSSLAIHTTEVLEQADISEFDKELIGNADFFIVFDEDMSKTH